MAARKATAACPNSGSVISALRAKVACRECGAVFRQHAEYTVGMNLWALPKHAPGEGDPAA